MNNTKFKDKRHFFPDKPVNIFSGAFSIYVMFFFLIIALFDINRIEYYFDINNSVSPFLKIIFLILNLWMIYIFIIGIALLWTRKKYHYLLLRLDKTCHEIKNDNFKARINYRSSDPFIFFSENLNKIIAVADKNKDDFIQKKQNLINILSENKNNYQQILEKIEKEFPDE